MVSDKSRTLAGDWNGDEPEPRRPLPPSDVDFIMTVRDGGVVELWTRAGGVITAARSS